MNFRKELNKKKEAKKKFLEIQSKGDNFWEELLSVLEVKKNFLGINSLTFFLNKEKIFIKESSNSKDVFGKGYKKYPIIFIKKYKDKEEAKEIFNYIVDKLIDEGFKLSSGPEPHNCFKVFLN